MTEPVTAADHARAGATPLWAILAVTFLASLGTGVFWNAIAFIAKHTYDFTQTRNLALYAVMGGVYTFGAFNAGRFVRVCERWMSLRTLLMLLTGVQAVVCIGPVLVEGEWALWLATAVVSLALSQVWPLVESYVAAGRHGQDMRTTIGWFNLVWMSAVAIPLLLMPPIIEEHGAWAIGGQAVINVVALVPLACFLPRPHFHDPELADANVPEEYEQLLGSARVLLPLSYVLNAALSPILPYRFEAIGAPVRLETPATATWMIVRVICLLVMWRAAFWHGRWGALLGAGVAMTGGFGLVVLAPSLQLMLVGFAAFGVGLGIAYYTALYYAMAVGRAEVDAGGVHEGLIGAGYTVGPLAGLLGTAIAPSPLARGQTIVAVVWALVGVGAVAAVRPYLTARRRRRQRSREETRACE